MILKKYKISATLYSFYPMEKSPESTRLGLVQHAPTSQPNPDRKRRVHHPDEKKTVKMFFIWSFSLFLFSFKFCYMFS